MITPSQTVGLLPRFAARIQVAVDDSKRRAGCGDVDRHSCLSYVQIKIRQTRMSVLHLPVVGINDAGAKAAAVIVEVVVVNHQVQPAINGRSEGRLGADVEILRRLSAGRYDVTNQRAHAGGRNRIDAGTRGCPRPLDDLLQVKLLRRAVRQ